jgi:hypothetical protein
MKVSHMVRADARILVGSDSTILEATDEALRLLGLTLDQLKSLPPGGLALEEDRDASAGFESAWTESGRGAILGAGTARLLDGRLIRVRYLITPQPDGIFEIILEQSEEAVAEPPRTYTVGGVLSAWRSAERKLEALEPGTREWAAASAEVDYFRDEYQRVAQRQSEQSG